MVCLFVRSVCSVGLVYKIVGTFYVHFYVYTFLKSKNCEVCVFLVVTLILLNTADIRSILVANIMRMSLTCYEEIERVGRVGRGCYQDASDFQTISTCQDNLACRWHVCNNSWVSGSWNLENDTTNGQTSALPDTRDILVTFYEDVVRVEHVREDATRMIRGHCSCWI